MDMARNIMSKFSKSQTDPAVQETADDLMTNENCDQEENSAEAIEDLIGSLNTWWNEDAAKPLFEVETVPIAKDADTQIILESGGNATGHTLLDGSLLPDEIKLMSIDELEREIDSYKISRLKRLVIYTIGELASTRCSTLTALPGFGPATLENLRVAIAHLSSVDLPLREGADDPVPFILNFDSLQPWQLQLGLNEDISLSQAQSRRLSEAGYLTVADLRDVSTEQVRSLKGFGYKALSKIASCLAEQRIATSIIPNPSMSAVQTAEFVRIQKDVRKYVGDSYQPVSQDALPIKIDSPRHIRNLLSDRDSRYDDPITAIPEDAGLSNELSNLDASWLPAEGSRHMVAALSHELKLARQADSYLQLLCQCLFDSNNALQGHSIEIYLRRNGLYGNKETLQNIADDLNLTRERIRQLAIKCGNRFKPQASRRFLLFRIAVLTTAMKMGGSGSLDKLGDAINDLALPYEGDPTILFGFCPEITLSGEDGQFWLSSYSCSQCKKLDAFRKEAGKELLCVLHSDALTAIGCDQCSSGCKPSPGFICDQSNLQYADGYIGTKDHPIMKSLLHPSSKRAVIHAILFETAHALTVDEIVDLATRRFGAAVSKAHVASQLTSFDDCMLWGRGTYIHENHAPNPKCLIEDVALFARSEFKKRNIPILGVSGLYEAFQNELEAEGIPTRHALYSLLRKLNDSALLLQEYPWICEAERINGRTSFAKYFYSVLVANNGFITDEHASGIADRVMAQSFALNGLAEYSPFVINANGGWYDIEAADFDMEGIAQLATEVAVRMGDDDVVSTKLVFEKNKERCFRYGVKSYDMLYYLIDMMEDDLPIEATRLPYLAKSRHAHFSALEAARQYIRASDHSVQKVELVEEFGVKRGINVSGMSTKLLTSARDIILVGTDTYWTFERLHIDEAFIDTFDSALDDGIIYSNEYADLFYSRNECLPSYDALPKLEGGMRWNSKLLRAIFAKSYKFRSFGEESSCIVDSRRHPNVTNTEKFYAALLENEFMGWSSFDRFAEYCNMYSIADELEPEFFDAFSSIRADEISIELV